MIISSGIGSGLDITGLVQQLLAAEAEPIERRLGLQEVRAQAKLSAFGSLKSALSEFRDRLDTLRDLDSFLSRTATSGNEEVLGATVTGDASPASYDIEVVRLATSQKLTSGAFASSDSTVGTGTLLLATGAGGFGVEISSENNTLAGIRDAINSAADNPGIAATVVNADSGSYLVLSSEKTGLANAITVTQTGGDGGLAALEYNVAGGQTSLTETVAAQDALVRIDGLDVQSDSNSIADAIQGVTLNLVSEEPGQTYALRVDNDETAARDAVAAFVETYNALVGTFDSATSFSAETQQSGPLLGDSTARGIRDAIRREMSTPSLDATVFSTLSDIGIEVQIDGTLSINDEELSEALSQEFSRFGQLFAADDGFAVRLYDRVDDYLSSDGLLQSRTDGLDAQIEDIGRQREASTERLLALESRLLRQFNALDSLIGELTNTSNFLTQQLASLPGFNSTGQNNG